MFAHANEEIASLDDDGILALIETKIQDLEAFHEDLVTRNQALPEMLAHILGAIAHKDIARGDALVQGLLAGLNDKALETLDSGTFAHRAASLAAKLRVVAKDIEQEGAILPTVMIAVAEAVIKELHIQSSEGAVRTLEIVDFPPSNQGSK